MIAYTMLGSNQPEAAQKFYETVFADAGIKHVFSNPKGTKFYGNGPGKPLLAIGTPHDDQEATCGNGTMVAIPFDTTDEIDVTYAKAIELGATDDGEPGWRMPDIFYGAYFRDLDGNKICLCKMNM